MGIKGTEVTPVIRSVVLLSGGLDSTVTLAYALSKGEEVIPITINYGQRHGRELRAARDVASYYSLREHMIMDIDLTNFSTSALISQKIDVPEVISAEKIGREIPVTYVPARNIIFLSIAAGLCESVGAERLYIGANAVDYSGYPDCRAQFFRDFQRVLDVGTKAGVEGKPVRIVTPIIDLTKAQIIKLGRDLNAPIHLTWSCYRGGERACGRCDSCLLRLKGFEDAGLKDPIEYEESHANL
jgi:7-cyano-7-deazaguanine synthase